VIPGSRGTSTRRLAAAATAVAVGASAGASPGGLVVIFSLAAAVLTVAVPGLGLMIVLITRPIVDCYWNQTVIQTRGISLNPQSVLGIIFPVAVAATILWRRWTYSPRRIELAILAYAAITAVGVVTSPLHVAALGDFGRIALPLSLFWLACHFGRMGKHRDVLLWAFSCYAFVPCVSALLQLSGVIAPVTGAVGSPTGALRVTGRVTGFYQHPLEIAMRACFSLPFALAVSAGVHKIVHKVGMILWALALAMISWATLVRSAIVVSAVEAVGWLGVRRHGVLAGACLTAVVALAPVIPQIRTVATEAVRPITEGSLYELGTGRGLLFAAQVAAFADAPALKKIFGRGLHSTPAVNVQYAPGMAIDTGGADFEEGNVGAHNQYLRVLTESGILGLAALVSALWLSVSCCWRVRRRAPSAPDSAMASATLVAVAGVIIFGLTATPVDSPWIAWPLWTAIGYVRGLDLGLA
jgi:hypothetical protein